MIPQSGSTSGGCQCGDVRYRLLGEPLSFYICHCRDCQRQSSSAFGMSLWVRREEFELKSGKLQHWTTAGESGAPKICAFCPRCGSRIYHATSATAEPLSVKAGTLDDPSGLRPIAQLWTRRAHGWLGIGPAQCLAFDEEPDNDEVLIDAWRDRSGP